MTPSEFMKEIENYWSKNREEGEVSKAIIGVVRNANSPALKATLAHLQKTVAPNYLIGVKHVMEAADASGSSLTRRAVSRFDVDCAGCGKSYSYSQGVSDGCPYCGMWYIDQQNVAAYKSEGKIPKPIQDWWLRRLDECGQKLENAQGGK